MFLACNFCLLVCQWSACLLRFRQQTLLLASGKTIKKEKQRSFDWTDFGVQPFCCRSSIVFDLLTTAKPEYVE
jgi:hypothetical protein